MSPTLALRWQEAHTFLEGLLRLPAAPMRTLTPSRLPSHPGVYAIWDANGVCLRAGRTDRTLEQRVYRNHLMGNQAGNLRAQLVADEKAAPGTQEAAKSWIRQNCSARWTVIDDPERRVWGEHVLLAILRPRY